MCKERFRIDAPYSEFYNGSINRPKEDEPVLICTNGDNVFYPAKLIVRTTYVFEYLDYSQEVKECDVHAISPMPKMPDHDLPD